MSKEVISWLEAGIELNAFSIKKGDTPYYSLSPVIRIQLKKDVLGVSIGTDFRDLTKYKIGASYNKALGNDWGIKLRVVGRDSYRLGRAVEGSLVINKGPIYVHGKIMKAYDYVEGDPEKHKLTALLEIGVRK